MEEHTEISVAVRKLNATQLTDTVNGARPATASTRYRRHTYGVADTWCPRYGTPKSSWGACQAAMSEISSRHQSTR